MDHTVLDHLVRLSLNREFPLMNVAFRSTLPVMLCASLLLTGCSTPAAKKPAERYQPPAGIKVAPPLQETPPAQTATPPAAGTPQTVAPQPITPAPVIQPAPVAKPLQPTPTPQPAPKPAAQATPITPNAAVAKPAPQPAVKSAAAATGVPAAAALTPTPTQQPPAPVKPVTPKPSEPVPVAAAKTSPASSVGAVALAAPKATPVTPKVTAPITASTRDTISPGTNTPETIKVSLDSLPLSIHGQWTLDRNESRCVLHSAVQKMEDGQGGTNVQLQLSPTEFTFITQSDIDLSYTGTGVRIDGGTPFALENVERRTNLAFSRQRSALLGAMKTGQQLELSLGFWPTWPVTQTYSTRFPLQHFASAYSAWETCNKLLSQR